VSWFDDHERFHLDVPPCAEGGGLRMLADDRCTSVVAEVQP